MDASVQKKASVVTYKTFDLMDEWQNLPGIPVNLTIHTVPAEVLNDMGWRMDGSRIFIPYFHASKETIPFAQWRHPKGDSRRFTMLKDAKPICYGMWNLDNPKVFIVEGTSDCAVLEYAAVPYIGLPSAASKTLMQSLCIFAEKHGISLVYASDKDLAGDQLREVLDELLPYRVKQVPDPYKDWGEFLEKTDIDTVRDYAQAELVSFPSSSDHALTDVRKVWPEAIPLSI